MDEKEKFRKQMDFLLQIDGIKNIYRQTYLADNSRKENDAEHSWHSALMAVVLSEYFPEANLLKSIKMMLFHDVVEIYAGDTYCYDERGNEDKALREKCSAQLIYGLLPEEQKEELIALWEEFEKGESPEARFCAVLDRLQPTMLNQASGFKSWNEHDINREQVLKRNAVTFSGPKLIGEYMMDIIQKAYEDGYLK